AFRPDGFLVTASSDGIKTWGPWTAEGVRTLKAPFSVEALAFSPDGRRLFGRSLKGSLVAWDLRAGRPTCTAFEEGRPFVLRWGLEPGGKGLLVTGPDGKLTWLDTATGQELGRLSNGPRGRTHLAFRADGKLLASGDRFGEPTRETEVWDVHSERLLYTRRSEWTDEVGVNCRPFSPDGKWTVYRADLQVRTVADDKEVFTLTGHTVPVNRLAFSPDGRRLASGDQDGVLKLWDLSTRAELLTYRAARGV